MSSAGVKHHYLNSCKEKITFRDYSKIIQDTIDAITTLIVEENVKFIIPGIGTLGIRVEKNTFKRKTVNTAESLKYRQQLEREGKIPLVKYKDENNNVIGDNGGEPWLIYYTKDTYCAWSINGKRLPVINNNVFKFTPIRENKKKLFNFIQTNPLKESFYATYKQ